MVRPLIILESLALEWFVFLFSDVVLEYKGKFLGRDIYKTPRVC